MRRAMLALALVCLPLSAGATEAKFKAPTKYQDNSTPISGVLDSCTFEIVDGSGAVVGSSSSSALFVGSPVDLVVILNSSQAARARSYNIYCTQNGEKGAVSTDTHTFLASKIGSVTDVQILD